MHKLYRSTRDRKILGVCGGLAEYFDVDSTLLRVVTAIGTVFSGGTLIAVYVIAGFVIPKEPTYPGFGGSHSYGPYHGGHGGPGWRNDPAWSQPPQHPPGPGPQSWQTGGPWPGAAPGPAQPVGRPPQGPAASRTDQPELDAMMDDIEKKALRREIEELKARIHKYESQSKGEE